MIRWPDGLKTHSHFHHVCEIFSSFLKLPFIEISRTLLLIVFFQVFFQVSRWSPYELFESKISTSRIFVNCNKIKQISLSWINRHFKRVEIRVRRFIDFSNCFSSLKQTQHSQIKICMWNLYFFLQGKLRKKGIERCPLWVDRFPSSSWSVDFFSFPNCLECCLISRNKNHFKEIQF